jgi:6-phosphogluconolactonase (cycloisomerase 2 family)
MIAAEGTTGTPNSATVTSYNALSSVSTATGPICNNQTSASCLKISKDGLYVFVTNTGSNSISTYATTSIGIIQLLDDNAANTGTAPADITLSANGTYLYTIDDGSHTISQFKRVNKAKLMKLGTITGLPASASGIAAY